MLKLKAEAELARLEKPPPPDAAQKEHEPSSGKDDPQDAGAAKPKPVDPKLIKAGYQKAIELAPRAVEQMEQAVKSLKQKDRSGGLSAGRGGAQDPRRNSEGAAQARSAGSEDKTGSAQEERRPDRSRISKKNEDRRRRISRKTTQQKKDQQKKDQEQKKQEEPKQVRRAEEGPDSSHSRRSRAIGSKRPCARSANGSRKSANETA